LTMTGGSRSALAQSTAQFTGAELKDFTSLQPINIHTHIQKSDPAFTSMLEHFNLHVLDIFVGHGAGTSSREYSPEAFASLKKQCWEAVESSGGRVKLSTTFDRIGWNDPDFSSTAISLLRKDFARGAVGATIWTNSTEKIKNPSGKFVMSDDPRLAPIYRYMSAHHIPLIAHMTGMDEAWVPDPGVKDSGEPATLAAREHVLEQNPELHVLGTQMGSVKDNLDQLSSRLDKYPNLAIDIVRMDYLMTLPADQVRTFILKYQDRILYGTDSTFYQEETVTETLAKWQGRLVLDWRYLSGNNSFDNHGTQIQSLHLPKRVLRKLYHNNAVRLVPGIIQGS
jgi:predicted TIM-barrel fold metal-dependent hydrolase